MHKFKEGQRLRVLKNYPCAAQLRKDDVVVVRDLSGEISYVVDRIGESFGWHVPEQYLSPIRRIWENE